MHRAAAFFDLDRTLLPGASGPVVADALREVGVLDRAPSPIEHLAFGFYDRLGETLPSMLLARQGVRMAIGWDRDDVERAGVLAAERLVERIQPWVPMLFDEHRRAGRAVVIASSSPYEVCRPLGDVLGCDDVIATRYGDDNGLFDGTLEGPFVWGRGKLEAVRTWADDHGVDLADSFAYTDSVFDAPLLGAVGHPVAVNPDPRLRLLAGLRRWPVRWLDAPEGVARFGGFELGDALRLVRPELVPYADLRFRDLEKLPTEGGAIVAANHRSYFDPLVIAMALARRGRVGRFLAKREVTDAPVVGRLTRALGTIRVDRGSGSGEPLEAAAAAIDAGEVVVILPQGTIPRGPDFFEPRLTGRPGVATLARLTGAPVVPVGLWGTEAVWPRRARLPNVTAVVNPPVVSVTAGAEVDLAYDGSALDVARIMDAIVELLPAEARVRRTPSLEELARTYPPGHPVDGAGAESGTAER